MLAKKIVDREYDQIRRTDAYGSPTIARLWLDN